jgi:hypothetical protein
MGLTGTYRTETETTLLLMYESTGGWLIDKSPHIRHRNGYSEVGVAVAILVLQGQ